MKGSWQRKNGDSRRAGSRRKPKGRPPLTEDGDKVKRDRARRDYPRLGAYEEDMLDKIHTVEQDKGVQ